MIELVGKYNTAKVFTDNIEQEAISQIIELCSQEFIQGSTIRIMPDTHAGAGCTIGTTLTIQDKVVPNLVGVDIGCGMHLAKLTQKDLDLEKLDKAIRKRVPSGHDVRSTEHGLIQHVRLDELRCIHHVNMDRARKSLGSLGGGNHFIEVDKDDEGQLYLVVHTGSRYLGKQVAEYYQKMAYAEIVSLRQKKLDLVQVLKKAGRAAEIETELAKIKIPAVSKDLAYLEGGAFEDYLHDMAIIQEYAFLNRKAIILEILNEMGIHGVESNFETIHNYIDMKDKILRKGAVSAKQGQELLIPINMRDGSLLCVGKGNPDWNYSAPHGAGRLMSRSKAKQTFGLDEFQESMKGIYTTSVSQSTIDEAPMVYKPMQEIIDNIQDTVEIVKVIKPIYNFKAGE